MEAATAREELREDAAAVVHGRAARLPAHTRGPETVQVLIPPMLEEVLLGPLEAHFEPRPEIEVVVDRRHRERRRREERRTAAKPNGADRRLVRSASGRRVGERRAALEPCAPLAMPPVASRFAGRVACAIRIPPSAEQLADLEDLRLVTQLQAGSVTAFDALYERYLARLHVYATAALGDPHEAEDVTHEALTTMLETMPDYEVRGIPLRIWVFRVLRNQVRRQLAKRSRLVVEDPSALNLLIDAGDLASNRDRHLFERVAENDFMERIARLTTPQRQVLVLRFLLDFGLGEVAALLDISPNAAANLQYRGLGALRDGALAPSTGFGATRHGALRRQICNRTAAARRRALHAFSW